MFKKSTRTKNIRRKIEVEDEDSMEIDQEITIQKTVSSNEKKKKKREMKTIRPLSFEASEDVEEEFQLKKTEATRVPHEVHRMRTTEPSHSMAAVDDPDTSNSSFYDAHSLKQLRDNTPSLPISMKSATAEDSLLHEKFPLTMNAKINTLGIPDPSAILAAKKLREQKRKGITVHDQDTEFISLEHAESDEEEKGGPRLTREEDEMDDGEEELEKYVGGKMTLNKTSKLQEKERREGLREMIEEVEDDDDLSEDMERWKEDRIKYGGVKSQHKDTNPYDPPANYKPAKIPDMQPLLSSADMILNMQSIMQTLEASIKQYENNLDETSKTIENIMTTEDDLMKEIERCGSKYNYFQELATYVNDLSELLDEKFSQLEKLETESHKIMYAETDIIRTRQWQDGLDDLHLFRVMPLSEDHEEAMENETDEFGRVRELRNSESARQRRRKERMKRMSNIMHEMDDDTCKAEGLWSDDEISDDYYEQKQFKLEDIETTQIENMMIDVKEEYRSLETVMRKLEDWKKLYAEDYEKAYGSLSVPTAFEFYIRSELVTLNPFSSPIEFDTMHWHTTLSQYGDGDMLNRVVEKYIITKIRSLLDTLNASSSRHMKYAAQVIDQISYYIEKDNKAYKELIMDVINTLEQQISHFVDMVETSAPLEVLDDTAVAAKTRFFWSQYKYLKTLMYWRRILPTQQLERLGHIVIDRIIAPFLNHDKYPEDDYLQNEALAQLSLLK